MKFKRENTTLHDVFMQGGHGQWKPMFYIADDSMTLESINAAILRNKDYIDWFEDEQSLEQAYKEGFITFHKDGFILWEQDFSR